MKPQVAETIATPHTVVSPKEWLQARKELLAREKELTRLRDELSRQRRELPWERVEKPYVFAGPAGAESLADLFAGRNQLIVYHFMFGPGWPEGCPSCSMVADHLEGSVAHLAQRDVTLVVASRAPLAEIAPFQKRMGWRFKWVSSHESDFNRDYHVSFTADERAEGKVDYNYGLNAFPSEEAPGVSVFYKDQEGEIFHTYSAYARGVEELLGVYRFLDFTPKGRDEGSLPFPMAWVRHHDRYDPAPAAKAACCSGEEHA
jgi:predicted dithiol-disulfide oxidoreductase (DUF899 family)